MKTPGKKMRSDVLAILRRHGGPLSAYDVLGKLHRNNPKIAPTTIYRALNALIESGHVHRVESLNAYIACQCDSPQHESILSICDDCGSVEENVTPNLLRKLSKFVGNSGFAPVRHVVEIHGLCSACGTEQASS